MGDPGDGGPPSLRAGDRVAVVAPSGPVDPARLERGCAVLRSLGLDVVVGKHALDQNPSGLTYLAGVGATLDADTLVLRTATGDGPERHTPPHGPASEETL